MAEQNAEAVLLQRLRSIAYWRQLMEALPGGVLPQALAAEMLGISPERLKQHRQEGRLRYVHFLGAHEDPKKILLSVDDLWTLGTIADRGRAGTYGVERTEWRGRKISSSKPMILPLTDCEQRKKKPAT